MYDFLCSINSENEALKCVSEVSEINKNAGFIMHSWISNSEFVNSKIGRVVGMDKVVSFEKQKNEKALGLHWCVISDNFTFSSRIDQVSQEINKISLNLTKRKVLQVVMSVFDTLGFLNPIMIRAKLLLQNIWRHGTGWDELLNSEDTEEWKRWVQALKALRDFSVPRCYFTSSSTIKLTELHIFCDASDKAYAAVAYARTIYTNGKISITLITSKSNVAPLTPHTVPRL